MPGTLEELIRKAEETLCHTGVATPREDAEVLAAYLLDVPQGRLETTAIVSDSIAARFAAIVARRADRVPLGHLTGRAVLGGVELTVGPGVFVPRIHSELVLAWGLGKIVQDREPVVVDLCTGSAAIALAVAHARPDAAVHAVDSDPVALDFARRNCEYRARLGDTPVLLHQADVTAPGLLTALDHTVSLVLANPPFVPENEVLLPEYGVHHPRHAIFGGPDGLDVIRHIVTTAARLLRPGGGLVIEHGHLHVETVPALLGAERAFTEVVTHMDQDGRPLYSTSVRV